MTDTINQVREDLEEILRRAEYTRTPALPMADEYNRLYELRTIVVNRVTRALAALSHPHPDTTNDTRADD